MKCFRALSAGVALFVALMIGSASLVHAQSTTSLQLALGNPSGATTSIYDETDYLIQRPQYSMSYHRYHGIPNWVSWHLGYLDLGSAPRGDFHTDTTLPSGWYRVTSSDYTYSGYDRGHMCPSADRTATTTDNYAVFYMSNILPQAPDNNQGPWAALETYCRSLVNAGNELYIISGGDNSAGTIAGGKVQIPAYVWKVIVVLPEGSNDLSRINTSTRVIAVDMPNVQGIRYNDWRQYRVSVDQVESYTGYNFLSNVSSSIQSVIESRVDTQ
ncbi:MAG: DNA/RNA non-specific endonuclease [Pyrinomonadaceae bacterium]